MTWVDKAGSWLLVSTSTSGGPAGLRVLVWRRLRGLGALYLQQSVCLLPDRAAVVASVEDLRDRVVRDGGSMRILRIAVTDRAAEAALVDELNAARDAEYDDVLERLPALHQELDSERRRGRTTFEEVEENETDLERFRSWTAKIAARDYFSAPAGKKVETALAAAAAALRAFETEAVRAAVPDPPSATVRALRTVQDAR